MAGAAIGRMICGAIVGLLIGTLIGAILLRAAIALYNKLAGGAKSPSSVPEPSFGRAMGITFVTALVNFVGSFIIGLIVGAGTAAAKTAGAPTPGVGGMNLLAQLISFPISLLIMAGMLTAMLPTTFGRAILVTLLYMVITIVLIAVIALVVILLFGAAHLGFGQ